MGSPRTQLLARIATALHLDAASVATPVTSVPLPAVTDVPGLAWASVAGASLAAATLAAAEVTSVDPDRIAVAYASERHLRIDGHAPIAFAPLSGFFRTADGWVRTHGNYAWHADALRRGLDLPRGSTREAVARAIAHRRSAAVADAIVAEGGICTEVRRDSASVEAQLRETPLIGVSTLGVAPVAPPRESPRDRPLRGIRVLDLTRVIAGPVATRTLALFGADVLRIDPPQHPEIPWQHLDTGHGKRSAVQDARSPDFAALLRTADVIVLGYRPSGLDALGLSPTSLARARPGIVVARLSAWGSDHGALRGFDSIVQAASGISWIESVDDETPGALPAQALDHSAGYLLAAGVMSALRRRAVEGGTWLVETSLRRVAAELLGMPRAARRPEARDLSQVDTVRHVSQFHVDGQVLQTASPAVAYDRGPTGFASPRPWGADAPAWAMG